MPSFPPLIEYAIKCISHYLLWKGQKREFKQLTSEISSSGWINLLVALVAERVAGLVGTVAGALATALLEGLEEEVEAEEETEGWVYAGNVALGGSEEAAVALWGFAAAAPEALCWACVDKREMNSGTYDSHLRHTELHFNFNPSRLSEWKCNRVKPRCSGVSRSRLCFCLSL